MLCSQVLFCPVLSCSVLFCPVLPCSVLFCSVLSCSVLFCPVLSCSVLFCSVLFCPVLSCPVLFCSVLDRPHVSGLLRSHWNGKVVWVTALVDSWDVEACLQGSKSPVTTRAATLTTSPFHWCSNPVEHGWISYTNPPRSDYTPKQTRTMCIFSLIYSVNIHGTNQLQLFRAVYNDLERLNVQNARLYNGLLSY